MDNPARCWRIKEKHRQRMRRNVSRRIRADFWHRFERVVPDLSAWNLVDHDDASMVRVMGCLHGPSKRRFAELLEEAREIRWGGNVLQAAWQVHLAQWYGRGG